MVTVYDVKEGKVKCPICKKRLHHLGIGKVRDEIRVDGADRFWCQNCVDEYNELWGEK